MSRLLCGVCVVLLCGVLSGCSGSRKEPSSQWDDDARLDDCPRRGVDGSGVLRSPDEPAIALRVNPDLEYVGNVVFVSGERARVDRHHFVDADRKGHVKRMVVMHFEAALPGTGLTFEEPAPENPVYFGGQVFNMSTSSVSNFAAVAAAPGGEAGRTTAFLDSRGLWLDDEQMVTRLGAVVNEDRTQRLTILYVEPASPARASSRGERGDMPAGLDTALTSRALASFDSE